MTWRSVMPTILGLILTACGTADEFNENKRSVPLGEESADGTKAGKKDGGVAADDGVDADDSGSLDDAGEGAGDGAGGAGDGGEETGEAYFTRVLSPVLNAQCVSCHADPRIPVATRGPLSIYSYAKMLEHLGVGTGKASNDLIDRVRGVAQHTGGNRCSAGLSGTPCKELQDWWTREFGRDLPDAPGSAGRVREVTPLGRAYGYAYDPTDATLQVEVSFFVGGPMGSCTAAGVTTANKAGADGSTPGDHAFFIDLPEAMRDGSARSLYAYAKVGGASVLLGTAVDFTAYAFSQAGRDYYNATVRPQLNACSGCHTLSYEQQFYSLIAPSPAQGATATNNQLMNKPSETNGTSHGGGQLCGNANVAPCTQIQEWWRREFQ